MRLTSLRFALPLPANGGQGGVIADPGTDPPREIPQPCRHCGGLEQALNGAHFKARREKARLPLRVLAIACHASISHLSEMENGIWRFQLKYAEIYDRVIGRTLRAGEYALDDPEEEI
jgi:hypothetical protein